MFRRASSDVDAFVRTVGHVLVASILLTHQVPCDGHIIRAATPTDVVVLLQDQVAVHGRHARSLLDDDLITPVLSMFSGPRSRCCKQLTLCDLATTLLQAVEANKAEDVDTIRKRKPNSEPLLFPRFPGPGRFRRAHEDAGDDSPPNPILVSIARTYLRRVQEDEESRRREAMLRAQETLDRERLALRLHQDYEDDDVGEPPLESQSKEPASPAIQKISRSTN